MANYTPLFSSLTTGTLCGKWPDIGLWPIVLSLADRYGYVDVTPDYLSRVTGLALQDVIACMDRFCQPDPYSRTPDNDGRRLERISPSRDWGWRVVNHSAYREKARKAAYDSARTASGADADRKRHNSPSPDESREVPRSPAISRSETETETKTETEKRKRERASRRVPSEFVVTDELRAWAAKNAPTVDIDRQTALMRDFEFRRPYTDWPAVWRRWMARAGESGAATTTSTPRRTRFEEIHERTKVSDEEAAQHGITY